MRKNLQTFILIICFCFCGCGSSEKTSNTEKLDSMLANYDYYHEEAVYYADDSGTDKVLKAEEAKDALISIGYLETDWVDVFGSPYGGDNSSKNILFVVHRQMNDWESYIIAYEAYGEIAYDWIEASPDVNDNCWMFSPGDTYFTIYIPSAELESFESWAVESGNYDAFYTADYNEYFEEEPVEVDEVAYKIEASENFLAYDYKDLLRNPDKYWGVKAYVIGDVLWSSDACFIVKNVWGEVFYVYKGIDAPNLLVGDRCAVFGEFNGTAEYQTTNEYGTVTTHTAVCMYAPFVVAGNSRDIPCDSRLTDLFYGTYEIGMYLVQFEKTRLIVDETDVYGYTIEFGNLEIDDGTEEIPFTFKIGPPHNVTKTGTYSPYHRSFSWDGGSVGVYFELDEE